MVGGLSGNVEGLRQKPGLLGSGKVKLSDRLQHGNRDFLRDFISGGSLHHKDHFSQKRGVGDKGPDFGKLPPVKTFMSLRHFPRNRNMAFWAHDLHHDFERPTDPAGSLEKNESLLARCGFLQEFFQITLPPRKKASEKKTVLEKT